MATASATLPSPRDPAGNQHLGLCTVRAATLSGLDVEPIDVEVVSRRGPASFQLVGLAEAAVREARVRVASALAGLGVLVDEYALTVSLAPADLRKNSAGLDLAIAVAVLGAIGHIPADAARGLLLCGELSIDGLLRPIRGVLPLLMGARRLHVLRAVVPRGNAAEAGYARGLEVVSAQHLSEVVALLQGAVALPPVPTGSFHPQGTEREDLRDVRGQASAKRALEIAAAGEHNLVLAGPPGSGKTLLARRLPGLLPALTLEAALEATTVHSVCGLLTPEAGILSAPPFRAPHHTVSQAGLVGGGSPPRPGEVSLAHNGVLFLDELTEFRRSVLEALRQPLEEGSVVITRARATATFPARPLLVGAMNPCPCGHWADPRRACRCTLAERRRYIGRLSGPLLDRIDLHVHVPPVDVEVLAGVDATPHGESSADVRARVRWARDQQLERQARGETQHATNARLTLAELRRVAALDAEGRSLLGRAMDTLGLSARGYVRLLRVARTIADLERARHVHKAHVAEAVRCRLLDHAAFAGAES